MVNRDKVVAKCGKSAIRYRLLTSYIVSCMRYGHFVGYAAYAEPEVSEVPPVN